jgi:hypothetical protein
MLVHEAAAPLKEQMWRCVTLEGAYMRLRHPLKNVFLAAAPLKEHI